MLVEFFEGLKENKRSKFYITILLLRRFIFAILLITLAYLPSRTIVGIISPLQIFYAWWIVFLRPYEEINEMNLKNIKNIVEMLNEIYFTFLFWALLFLNLKSDWNSTKTSIYMYVLASNTMIVFLIAFGNINQ